MNVMQKTIARVVYFFKTGYLHTNERVNPDFLTENFANHLKAYRFVLQFAAGKRVLDMECGTGYGSAELAEVATGVTGIDISRAAIRFARKRFPKPTFLVMDAHALKFPEASFDLIVSTENFEHLSDQRSHLRELRRVLAPGGLCFIASPNPEMFQGVHNPYHRKENTFAELSQLLPSTFSEFVILENILPHTQDRPHGVLPDTNPLIIFDREIDKTWLSNTHSFFIFCR